MADEPITFERSVLTSVSQPVVTPPVDQQVHLVGALPDWVVVAIEDTRFGDGPR